MTYPELIEKIWDLLPSFPDGKEAFSFGTEIESRYRDRDLTTNPAVLWFMGSESGNYMEWGYDEETIEGLADSYDDCKEYYEVVLYPDGVCELNSHEV